jgi:nitroimidazol reductase NimA-like FMN-containing flavoprotein (pyridoxamine 5'-phosphate oxidase superfamily)
MTELPSAVTELSDEESWELLNQHVLGRLAYHLATEVHIVPVNYAVVDRRILFRTTPGSKLLGVILSADVAFEIDEVDPASAVARSVVLRGVASRLDDAQVRARGEQGPHPWVEWETEEVVAIWPTSLSGRSFRLDRERPAVLSEVARESGSPDEEADDG